MDSRYMCPLKPWAVYPHHVPRESPLWPYYKDKTQISDLVYTTTEEP